MNAKTLALRMATLVVPPSAHLGVQRRNITIRIPWRDPQAQPPRDEPRQPGRTTVGNVGDLVRTLAHFPTNSNSLIQLDRLRQLVTLLHKDPEASKDAWKAGVVPILLELANCGQVEREQQARLALSLLGYAPPYSGRGIRILSVDGGGTKGLLPLVILKHFEKLCNQRTHEMFDYVCGTSTGAIVTALLCMRKDSVEEVEVLYRELSTKVFKMNNLLGIGQLFLNHAFYDAKLLEKIIRREPRSEQMMYEISRDREVPRMSFVSTLVNQPVVRPFLFTTYRHHPDNRGSTNYPRTTDVRIWEALMASSAAPGYFEEVKLGDYVHHDGGLLTNNPCAIAVHEARLLWGKTTPIQCIVSLGTGTCTRHPDGTESPRGGNNTSLREKLTKLVASATDTEAVHTILKDLLPATSYFRFNPELSEDIAMDESNPDKLAQLVADAENYIEENRSELERAAAYLLAPKKPSQKAQEWAYSHWNRVISKTHQWTIR